MKALLLTLWATQGAWASLTVPPTPTVGVEQELVLTDDDGAPRPGETLRVVTLPGLPGQDERGAGITDSRGRVVWTPKVAGPAVIYAGDDPVGSVDVAWATPPGSAVVPFALLVLAALGAIAYGGGLRRPRS